MSTPPVDLAPLRNALAQLQGALKHWSDLSADSPLKPHLRSAVIRSFEFTYELALKALRRVLIERANSAAPVADLSFNDLLRLGADAGLLDEPPTWRQWREMRNATSHAYDETKAQRVALACEAFAQDAQQLLDRLSRALTP